MTILEVGSDLVFTIACISTTHDLTLVVEMRVGLVFPHVAP